MFSDNPLDGFSPPLSVVIATIEPWPAIKECLDSLLPQARELGAEVIVADGDGHGLPDDRSLEHIVNMRAIGASTYHLRAIGALKAHGKIVGFTEDHCRVSSGWCEEILALHQQYPEAVAIGGPIENGSNAKLLDWVHFLIAKGPFLPPVTPGETTFLSGQANMSFKRHVLPAERSDLDVCQEVYLRKLRKQGWRLSMHTGPVVWHFQSPGVVGACRLHFHNGKTIAGFRRSHLSQLWKTARIASCVILPAFLVGKTIATVFRKRRRRFTLLLGLPFLVLLATCHTLGEFAGYLKGPGNSPRLVN